LRLSAGEIAVRAHVLQSGDEALLIAAAKVIDETEVPSLERSQSLLADPCFVAVVALDGNAPVGLIYGHVLPQLTRTGLLIYSVDTAETHRRKGAARTMIAALRRLSETRGFYEMWVLTSAANAPAMALYAGCGGVRETDDDVMWVFPIKGPSG
jgi:GNAT superfamily N-acetyltransferase